MPVDKIRLIRFQRVLFPIRLSVGCQNSFEIFQWRILWSQLSSLRCESCDVHFALGLLIMEYNDV